MAASSSSSTAASWTSNDVAPATTEEIKAASYLIISAAFDDFVPEVYTTLPRKLHHFIDEVKDGTATDASLKFAKDWLDTTGQCPYNINPVHAVLASKHKLFLTMNDTYRWRTKLTAGSRDPSRLCASFDGKHKASRLKTMLPSVAHFILTQGSETMWAELVAAGGKQRTVRRKPSCTISRGASVRYCSVLYGTSVRYRKMYPLRSVKTG